jgi:DNA-binding transcriptional LysR family regulator
MSRIGRSTSAPAPRLSLGTPMFWAASVFAQAIKEFRSRQPDFRFEMTLIPPLSCKRWKPAHSTWAWASSSSI